MITDDYVSFEIAKLLKENGFNEPCYRYATSQEEYDSGDWVTNGGVDENSVGIPTHELALKWLRETHNILIVIDYEYEYTSTSYCYKIYELGEYCKPKRIAIKGVSYDKNNNPTEHIVGFRDYTLSKNNYATYEEAVEDGIKYALNIGN